MLKGFLKKLIFLVFVACWVQSFSLACPTVAEAQYSQKAPLLLISPPVLFEQDEQVLLLAQLDPVADDFEEPEEKVEGLDTEESPEPVESLDSQETPESSEESETSAESETSESLESSEAMEGDDADPFEDDPFDDDPFASDAGGDNDFEDPFGEEQAKIPPLSDPLEGYNRFMHGFNDGMYEYVLEPVATNYRDFVHENFRVIIKNLYNTLKTPVKLVNSLLQWEWGKAGRVLGRFVINTTCGWGGMFDVAGYEYGIKDVNEDFGQTLGVWGIGPGFYFVIPLLGPSTIRDTVGFVADGFLNPLYYVSPGLEVSLAVAAGEVINETSFRIEDIKALKEGALDPYVSFRDFYHQFREAQIKK